MDEQLNQMLNSAAEYRKLASVLTGKRWYQTALRWYKRLLSAADSKGAGKK